MIIITSVVITSPSSRAVMVTLDVVQATNPWPFPHLNLYSLNQHHIQSEWAKYLHVISRGVHREFVLALGISQPNLSVRMCVYVCACVRARL